MVRCILHAPLPSSLYAFYESKSIFFVKDIEVIIKFAQMEMGCGQIERFTSLFENVITNFPKRTDVWSVYIDQLIKSKQFELTRYHHYG